MICCTGRRSPGLHARFPPADGLSHPFSDVCFRSMLGDFEKFSGTLESQDGTATEAIRSGSLSTTFLMSKTPPAVLPFQFLDPAGAGNSG